MKNLKLFGLLIALSISLHYCKGQNKTITKETMNTLTEETFEKYVKQYPVKPVYSMQVSKQGCRVVIESYNRDYRFVENNGETMMFPFNYMITKSGEQKVKIKVYPKEGEPYITKYAHAGIKVYYAPDKDTGLKDYQPIAEFILPQGLEPQKLPYYEGKIVFNANVPFDYSKDLETAKDLTKIADIENLVKKKYLAIQKIAKNNDIESYFREQLFSFGKVSNTMYETLEKTKNTDAEIIDDLIITSPSALEKEFLPLDDTELQFYAEGKVVALWHKGKLTSGLDMKFKYKKKDGSLGESTSADPMFLYMPEGSNELKIW